MLNVTVMSDLIQKLNVLRCIYESQSMHKQSEGAKLGYLERCTQSEGIY